MNWNSIVKNDLVSSYYEVTLQVFYANGKPMSNMTMIPVMDKINYVPEQGLSFIFLQVPMQALLTCDLALVLQIYKVTLKPVLDHESAARVFGLEKHRDSLRVLEGWSIINLSQTYTLTNTIGGQPYLIDRLRCFATQPS